jgi:hypothetical protein
MKETDASNSIYSKIIADRFIDELERIVKRFNPESFGPTMSNFIYESIVDQKKWRYFPLHFALNAIEANCAYHRSYRNDAFDDKWFRILANHYIGFEDPYLHYVLDGKYNLLLPFVAMARQQFIFQRYPNQAEFARSLLIFVLDNPLPKTEKLFSKKYDLNFEDWLFLCFSTLTAVFNDRPPIVSIQTYLESDILLPKKESIGNFLSLSSLTISGIRDEYIAIRSGLPTYLHGFLPSVFFDYPLIAYSNGTFLVPHPYFIFRQATEGLYRICSELDREIFAPEFSRSFERYVYKVLMEIPGVIKILREAEIQRESPGRVCDYLIDLQDCILLVECKAIRYSSKLMSEKAISQDNSTTKIVDALEQLFGLAYRLQNGELNNRLTDPRKPLIGICVTYGEIEFVNSPMYFDTFISPKIDLPEKEKLSFPKPFNVLPQIMSIETFERFIQTILEKSDSTIALMNAKLSENYFSVGDWPSFLNLKYNNEPHLQLKFLEDASNYFFNKKLRENVSSQKKG